MSKGTSNWWLNCHLPLSKTVILLKIIWLIVITALISNIEISAIFKLTLGLSLFLMFLIDFYHLFFNKINHIEQKTKHDWIITTRSKQGCKTQTQLLLFELKINTLFCVLHFTTVKNKQTTQYVIWRDQLHSKDWRHLTVLARHFTMQKQDEKTK